MWADVLKVLKEVEGIPWDALSAVKDTQCDDDHLKVCRILLTQIHANLVRDASQTQVLHDVLIKESPGLFMLLTNSWLQEFRPSFKRDFLQKVVEKFISSSTLAKIVAKTENQENELVGRIVGLPDLIGNTYQDKIPSFFIGESYFRKLIQSLKDVLHEDNLSSLTTLVNRLALRGCTDLLNEIIFQDESLVTKSSVLITKASDEALDPILKAIFTTSKSSNHVLSLVSDEAFNKSRVQYLLLNKFILVSYFPVSGDGRSRIPRNLMEFLQRRSLESLFESMKVALTAYSSRSSIKNRTIQQNLYIFSLLATSVKFIPSLTQDQKEELRHLTMKGIEEHMKNTSNDFRFCSLFLGQTLVNNLSKDAPKLDFEVDKDEYVNLIEAYMKPPPTEYLPEVPVLPTVVKKPLIEVVGEENGHQEKEIQDEFMFDDPIEPKKKPMYLTDCFEGLLEVDKHEWLHSCLEAASDLIRNNPSTARELAVDMTRVLLYLNNECDIQFFGSWRADALVSITVVAPSTVAHYLISEFYSRNISMSTRLDILDTLSKASQEISGRSPSKPSPQKSLEESLSIMSLVVPQEAHAIQNDWKAVLQSRIDQKTKRFVSKSKTEAVAAAPNAFGKCATYFFFPLIESFDGKDVVFQVQDFDSLIVGRLIFCLGVLMDSAKNTVISRRMARSLLPFIANFKNHNESMVRQAVAFAFCAVLTSVSRVVLLEELREDVLIMKNWLLRSSETDPDDNSRYTAVQGLFLLNELVLSDNH